MTTIKTLLAIAVSLLPVQSAFAGCDCTDWIERSGYCVDYVKSRIAKFPIPQRASEIAALKNREPADIEEGDVAIFALRNYWHVAYVEKVHKNSDGDAISITVTEMNYGSPVSTDTLVSRWGLDEPDELHRALCCGITEQYKQIGSRSNIPINTVTQAWSPDNRFERFSQTVIETIRDAIIRFKDLAERSL